MRAPTHAQNPLTNRKCETPLQMPPLITHAGSPFVLVLLTECLQRFVRSWVWRRQAPGRGGPLCACSLGRIICTYLHILFLYPSNNKCSTDPTVLFSTSNWPCVRANQNRSVMTIAPRASFIILVRTRSVCRTTYNCLRVCPVVMLV